MRVLVACEESQAVCIAFRELGHEAYSCDLQDCSGHHPEWHLKADALITIRRGGWDMIIAHPPCTYMTNASAVRMRVKGEIVKERYEKAMEAKQFFMDIWNADCPKICIENPTPMKLIGLPPYTQAIQPYWFGHPYSKRTCLWLKGLPLSCLLTCWPTMSLMSMEVVRTHMAITDDSRAEKNEIPRYAVRLFPESQKRWHFSGVVI